MSPCTRPALTEHRYNIVMNNKERVNGWLEDIKDEVERFGAYDPDDQIRVITQMIESLQKFVKEDC